MRFQNLDLNLLVALYALLNECSVSAAAESVHITQPAMSHSLAKLRQHFADELLVVVGRSSVLTPRAQSLIDPLRDILLRIDGLLAGSIMFDPVTTSRKFIIRTSDYSLAVSVAPAIRRMKVIAPNIEFELAAPDTPLHRLERGEADFNILPQQFLLPDHPHLQLFDDEYVVAVWSQGELAHQEITFERYFELGHIAVRFGADRQPDLSEAFTLAPPRPRHIAITVPSFTLVATLVVGTSLVASMPRRLAELSAQTMPLTIKPLPFTAPQFLECVQWSRLRNDDPGMKWVIEQLRAGN